MFRSSDRENPRGCLASLSGSDGKSRIKSFSFEFCQVLLLCMVTLGEQPPLFLEAKDSWLVVLTQILFRAFGLICQGHLNEGGRYF